MQRKSFILSIFFSAIICLFSGCTTSLTIIHTQGEATDIVDETQAPTNDVSPELSIPAKLL